MLFYEVLHPRITDTNNNFEIGKNIGCFGKGCPNYSSNNHGGFGSNSGSGLFYLTKQTTSSSNLRNIDIQGLKNGFLRVLVPKIDPPFVNYFNYSAASITGKGYSPGVVIEILEELGQMLNLTYEYVFATDNVNGYLNDSYDKIFTQNRIDVIADAAVQQYSKSIFSEMTNPFTFQYTGMMIRSPDRYNDNTWLIVTEPFTWQIWVLILISVIISGFWLKISNLIISKVYCEVEYNYFTSTWVFFSVFVQQGLHRQPTSWTSRIVVALWWLSSVTLLASFTGSLVALFAVERDTLPMHTIYDVVKALSSGRYRILMITSARWQLDIISGSSLPIFKTLWEEISIHQRIDYVEDVLQGIEKVKTSSNYIFFGPLDILSTYAAVECQVTMLPDSILPVYLSIPMPRTSPYLRFFSAKIHEFVEYGLVSKWLNDYRIYILSRRNYRCNSATDTHTKKGFLTLSQTQGAFWILCSGIFVSCIYLIFECSFCFSKILGIRLKNKLKNQERKNSQNRIGIQLANASIDVEPLTPPISIIPVIPERETEI